MYGKDVKFGRLLKLATSTQTQEASKPWNPSVIQASRHQEPSKSPDPGHAVSSLYSLPFAVWCFLRGCWHHYLPPQGLPFWEAAEHRADLGWLAPLTGHLIIGLWFAPVFSPFTCGRELGLCSMRCRNPIQHNCLLLLTEEMSFGRIGTWPLMSSRRRRGL